MSAGSIISLDLIGNVLGLAALVGKTIYELFVNKQQYKRDRRRLCDEQAVQKKRNRTDWATLITFIVLGFSYVAFILQDLLPQIN
jgi:nicotinamide riboside transporter PnuC